MTENILNVFSSYDPERLSRDKLSDTMTTSAPLDDILRSLDRRLAPLLSSDTPIWFRSSADESTSFLSAVDELLATIDDWMPLSDDDRFIAASLDRAEDLLQKSILRLESEFRSLLDNPTTNSVSIHEDYYSDSDPDSEEDDGYDVDSIPVARPVTDYNLLINLLPSTTITSLNSIAIRMINAEYSRECSQLYSAYRRDFLAESLTRLTLRKTPVNQSTPWSDIEESIDRWIKAATVTLRILFPSERRLCDRIFSPGGGGGAGPSDMAFMQVCRGANVQLLSFADAVAVNSKSPERLFRVLDVYETLRDLMPEFDALFSNPYCAVLRTEAVATWRRLAEAIRGIFTELENLIRRDPPKQVPNGGGVHPITRYVMNYLRAACKSRVTLEQVYDEEVSRTNTLAAAAAAGGSSSTSLSMQMAWTMELLESNLESKTKLYNNDDQGGLSSIFLINNGKYIVQKVRDSELGVLLGEDWVRKHTMKLKQLGVSYQRSSWNKVLALLKIDDDGGNKYNAAPSDDKNNPRSLREKLRLFNVCFEETCDAQSNWVVIDEQVKEDLKMAVAESVSVAYRNFLSRFYTSPEGGRNADRYIKYSLEDVEAWINSKLFQGKK